jgi:hypothetical protein
VLWRRLWRREQEDDVVSFDDMIRALTSWVETVATEEAAWAFFLFLAVSLEVELK